MAKYDEQSLCCRSMLSILPDPTMKSPGQRAHGQTPAANMPKFSLFFPPAPTVLHLVNGPGERDSAGFYGDGQGCRLLPRSEAPGDGWNGQRNPPDLGGGRRGVQSPIEIKHQSAFFLHSVPNPKHRLARRLNSCGPWRLATAPYQRQQCPWFASHGQADSRPANRARHL